MKTPRKILLTAALLTSIGLLIVGCGNADNQPPRVPDSPATQPTVALPATMPGTQPSASANPASTQPTASVLVIDGHVQIFAPAMLRLSTTGGHVVAHLYSDDPRSALTDDNGVANSYDFQMDLTDISDPADIAKSVWTCQSASSDRQETPYGIFLNNQQMVLQPMDAQVRFSGQPPLVQVMLSGNFRLYRTDQIPSPPPMIVKVVGSLPAMVPGK